MSAERPVVTIVFRLLAKYRVPFYVGLREELDSRGITLRLLANDETKGQVDRDFHTDLDWAERYTAKQIHVGSRYLLWQPVTKDIRNDDLIIVEQASRLLLNYVLLAWQRLRGPKVALWGHGEGLQPGERTWVGEKIKTASSKYPHWWFAYNQFTVRIVEGFGYPADRITDVQNSTDSKPLASARAAVTDAQIDQLRDELGIKTDNVAMFLGSLYNEKRPEFLIESALAMRAQMPDFELLILGSGPVAAPVEAAAAEHDWIHHVTGVWGVDVAPYAALAKVLVMPGLVGLAVVDAFALDTPMITCDIDYHSPEIDYLEVGVNGEMAPGDASAAQYAQLVTTVMADEERLARLHEGCAAGRDRYTMEEMVQRFADGVEKALGR